MTDLIDLGLDTRTSRIRLPKPTPQDGDWEQHRSAASVHRLWIRRTRRLTSACLRSRDP
jgi:hypothetical protein